MDAGLEEKDGREGEVNKKGGSRQGEGTQGDKRGMKVATQRERGNDGKYRKRRRKSSEGGDKR